MDTSSLLQTLEPIFLYGVAPALGLSALVLSIRLRTPQLRRLGAGFSAETSRSEARETLNAPGPRMTAALSAAGAYGAAGVVGAATSVSLGGLGTLPYYWLFAILLGALRYSETWLARTAPPGSDPDSIPENSLVARLAEESRGLGLVAFLFVLAGASYSFTHAEMLHSAVDLLFPSIAMPLVLAVCAAAAVLALLHRKGLYVLAGLGVVGLLTIVIVSIWSIASDPSACAGVLAQSFGAAFSGTPQHGNFTGALAGETAFAALLFVLAPMISTLGSDGAVQRLAAARTRTQTAASVLAPLLSALVGTLLILGMAGTGVFSEQYPNRVALDDLRFYQIAAETVSQRLETERRYSGLVRVIDGEPRNPNLSLATARGGVTQAKFYLDGELANIALHVDESGRADEMLVPGSLGALEHTDPGRLYEVVVEGEMLLEGAPLVVKMAQIKASDLASRLLLAGLLALGAVALAFLGLGLGRSAMSLFPKPLAMVCFALPGALGALALFVPGLGTFGILGAGIGGAGIGLLLLKMGGEVAKLDKA